MSGLSINLMIKLTDMLQIARKLFCAGLLLCLVSEVGAQSYTQAKKEETQKFILKVLAQYKNPMSYYPLRRDIFLPDEEEVAEDELKKSYPEGARSLGFIVFIDAQDTTYHREPFIAADGDLLDLSHAARRTQPSSMKSNASYFRKKQLGHLNRYPSLGRFLYYNATFSPTY